MNFEQVQDVLRKSLDRNEPFCASEKDWKRTAESLIDNLGWAPGYAEPGYTDPENAILFSNWNYFPRDIDKQLEGYELEWEDEWSTCYHCGKAFRTSPDSYCWQPAYVALNDCELICRNCLKENPSWVEEYLEELEDNPRQALNNPDINPAEFGYVKLEGDFESGFHPGQTADPKKIFKRLEEAGHKRILFQIDDVGQFDTRFSVWKKKPEEENESTEAGLQQDS